MSIFSRKTEVPEPLQDHTVYLIDTENVRTVWTLLLERMTENDRIYVFYTQNSGNVSYEEVNGVISSGKNVQLIQCHTGKNGLDFQLVSYLGYLIRDNENADYCIISDDSGYDAVIKFWEGRDVDVMRKTAAQISGKTVKSVKKSLFGVKKPKPAVKSEPKSENKPVPKAEAKTAQKSDNKPAPKPAAKADPKQKPKTETKPTLNSESKPVQKPDTKQPSVSKQDSTDKAEDSVKSNASSKQSKATEKKESPVKTAEKNASLKNSGEMEGKLKLLLPDEPDDMITLICDIIVKSGGKKGLAQIHDEIEKIYRNEKASEIYRIIRHNLNDIYH